MQKLKHPQWLKRSISHSPDIAFTKSVLAEFGLNTVCQSAKCPNIFECFSRKTATVLILGDTCTRHCAFCSVKKGTPANLDKDEPNRIAAAAAILGLREIVITSVTRDDLVDGGAHQFVKTIEAIRRGNGKIIELEVLIPDFKGSKIAIEKIVDARPDIFGHNLETAPRLYNAIRPEADYRRSLGVLEMAKKLCPHLTAKSGFMLGLGETEGEVVSIMKDLRMAGCDMLAIGQYLRPSPEQIEVKEFIRPEIFLKYKEQAYIMGFKKVWSGPFIRSSYKG